MLKISPSVKLLVKIKCAFYFMEKNTTDFLANPTPPRAGESNQRVARIPPKICSPKQSVAGKQRSPRFTAPWVCILGLPPHTDARPGVRASRASADLTILAYKTNHHQSAFPVGRLRGFPELRYMSSVTDTVMDKARSEERESPCRPPPPGDRLGDPSGRPRQ